MTIKHLHETQAKFYLSDLLMSIKNGCEIIRKIKIDSINNYLETNINHKSHNIKKFMNKLAYIRHNLINLNDEDWSLCLDEGIKAIEHDKHLTHLIIILCQSISNSNL